MGYGAGLLTVSKGAVPGFEKNRESSMGLDEKGGCGAKKEGK